MTHGKLSIVLNPQVVLKAHMGRPAEHGLLRMKGRHRRQFNRLRLHFAKALKGSRLANLAQRWIWIVCSGLEPFSFDVSVHEAF